jgi:hypothetical protein
MIRDQKHLFAVENKESCMAGENILDSLREELMAEEADLLMSNHTPFELEQTNKNKRTNKPNVFEMKDERKKRHAGFDSLELCLSV